MHYMKMENIENIMRKCIDIAQKNSTPFGAALVNQNGNLLHIAPNTGKKDGPLAHAEMNVLKYAHNYPDQELTLVTTCEPCPMCASAAVWARINTVYYGIHINEAQHFLNQIRISSQQVSKKSFHSFNIKPNVLHDECFDLFRLMD